MTVASTNNRNTYTGNGATSTFSYMFKIYNSSELKVVVRNLLNVETILALNTDYTVSGAGSINGGSISLVNSSQSWLTSGFLTTGYVISIRRLRPLTQITDIRNQGDYWPEGTEDEFDRQVMVDQQQQDSIDRSVKLPETVLPANFNPEIPAAIVGVPNVMVITDPTGTKWAVGPDITQVASNAAAAAAAAASAATAQTAATASQTAAAASATSATASQTSATASAASATSAATAGATSATNAANSATAAATSATNAATSATQAAATLAGASFNTITNVTAIGSTSLTSANNGNLFDVDTTLGAISFNLPQISTVTLPFMVGFSLRTASGVLTINANASDHINGSAPGGSVTLTTANTGYFFYARSGNWAMLALGASGGGGGSLTPIPNNTLLGNVSGGTAIPTSVNVTSLTSMLGITAPLANSLAARDSVGNLFANNTIENLSTTATAAGTTPLTASSSYIQQFTGTSTQTITLPDVTTLPRVGFSFTINNRSTGALTVNSFGSNLVQTIASGAQAIITCTSLTLNTAAGWDSAYSVPSGGSTSPLTTKGDLYGFDTAGNRIPVGANGTSLIADSTQALGLKWSAPQPSPTASTNAAWDANKNLSANNHLEGFATTATAAGTTTLVVGSAYLQQFTGTSTQTVVLPVVSTLALGQSFSINNRSTGFLTVNSSGANLVQTVAPGSQVIVTCSLTTGTTAASWDVSYTAPSGWVTSTASTNAAIVPPTTAQTSIVYTNSTAINLQTSIFSTGGTDGQTVRIWGPNNTSGTVSLTNNNTNNGQIINGNVTLQQFQMIEFQWLAQYLRWIETDRNF